MSNGLPLHRRNASLYLVLSECLLKKKNTCDSGGIQTHYLLHTNADVLTSENTLRRYEGKSKSSIYHPTQA